MEIPLYLAMTSDDIKENSERPTKFAWMSVRFDKNGDSLINFPRETFDSCILILDDCNPFTRHDQRKICEQLQEHVSTKKYDGILLDFQRPNDGNLWSLVRLLEQELPAKVAVTPDYSAEKSIVFLPPLPPAVSVGSYLKPWSSHEIWLDLTTQVNSLCITANGAAEYTRTQEDFPFYDKALRTHYKIIVEDEEISFSFQRTREDCLSILDDAEAYNVRMALSLYHEMAK